MRFRARPYHAIFSHFAQAIDGQDRVEVLRVSRPVIVDGNMAHQNIFVAGVGNRAIVRRTKAKSRVAAMVQSGARDNGHTPGRQGRALDEGRVRECRAFQFSDVRPGSRWDIFQKCHKSLDDSRPCLADYTTGRDIHKAAILKGPIPDRRVMAIELKSLGDMDDWPFDQIIDARAPAEFADDHLPGAINLPVLDDDERARVGTEYVQNSRFNARKMGAALVSRNVAQHLETALGDKDGAFRPLVYCWRGGQRSGAFASILAQIGWRVETLSGGYRAYRRLVVKSLYQDEIKARVVVLSGHTGTAKTDILNAFARIGGQTLDLEGLAHHRGSIFGARAGGQPSQKAFEGALAQEITHLDPAKPVLVEAESSKIGNIVLPPSLWKAMSAAPRIQVTAPMSERAAYLARSYGDLIEDPEKLLLTIRALGHMHAKDVIADWEDMARAGAFEALAAALMERHYDPRYSKSMTRTDYKLLTNLDLADLSPDGVLSAAKHVADILDET